MNKVENFWPKIFEKGFIRPNELLLERETKVNYKYYYIGSLMERYYWPRILGDENVI